ncbi:MAG: tetratricopeptide repeat protein [Acidobacteriota bacterium]|nr:tetratricopeptide repeat protein [Acidobacteriota bacterium]
MSFDKEKLRRAAEKNLAQGKIQAAIRDYTQLVQYDPRDYNTLNTLGDLFVRVSAKNEAIKCFERIAEYYDTQGFTHKAIAMYKKIARLKPDDITISSRLAPLYQTLGLIAEARTHFLTVADFYQQKGDRLPALEIWHQIADLDPTDVQTRLNLAESYFKENQLEKAVEAFTESGKGLLAKKRLEEAVSAFSQALSINPHFLPALIGVTEAHIVLGFPDEAIEKLENAQGEARETAEYYSLLGKCYLELENATGAESAILSLIEKDPSNCKKMLDVTKIYVKNGDLTAAVRTIEFCAEFLLSGSHEADLEFWVNEILTRDPEHIKALHLLARLHSWNRNELQLKEVLERVVEAAHLNELEEEEKNALSELRLLFPNENKYTERLRELGVEIAEDAAHAPVEFNADQSVPSFESFAGFHEETEEHSFEILSSSDVTGKQSWDFSAQTVKVENSHAPAQFEDFQVQDNFANQIEAEDAMEFEQIAVEFEQKPDPTNYLAQELESIDFYISQGYNELALESLLQIEAQFGQHPEITHRREKLQPPVVEQETISFDFSPMMVEQTTVVSHYNETTAHLNGSSAKKNGNGNGGVLSVNPNFADLFEEFGEDLEVNGLEAQQTADFETHYNLGLAYKEMGLFDDAVEEFQNAVKMVSVGDGTPRFLQCCNLIGHCFVEKGMPDLAIKWYQRGLDAPGHSEEEYQALRYELGTAYEKTGEKEKAIAQFTEIYAVNVAYRGVGEKLKNLQLVG